VKKPVKLILFLVLPLALLGGGGFFAVYSGMVEVPFLPEKEAAPVAAEKETEEPKEPVAPPASVPAVAKPTPVAKPKKPEVVVVAPDPARGDRKLAELWNAIETPKLMELTKDWREEDLARVMLKMDPSVVAEYLAAMPDAKRASSLSRRIRDLASIPPS
jgi:hypothetical protein